MHQPHFTGPVAHAGDEVHQAFLVGVGGIATQGVDASLDLDALTFQGDIATAWAVLLNSMAGGAFGLVTDEDHVVAWITEHGSEVVDDASGAAHAVAGDDDGGLAGVGQAVNHGQVLGVGFDGEQVVEGQGLAAIGDAFEGFFVPVGFELPVEGGEAAG